MAMTIPTIPDLQAGYIATAADMNNLAAACTFLLTKPLCRVHDITAGQTIGASGNAPATTINFTTEDIDTDGMFTLVNPGRITVATPGWYKVRYGVNLGTAGATCDTAVYQTRGSGNPLGAGTNGPYLPGYALSHTTKGGCAASSGIWPYYLYGGDYLQLKAGGDAGTNVTATTDAGSYFSLEFVST